MRTGDAGIDVSAVQEINSPGFRQDCKRFKEFYMLWIIILVLIALWVIALLVVKVTSVLIHLLLVVALVVFILKMVKGQKLS